MASQIGFKANEKDREILEAMREEYGPNLNQAQALRIALRKWSKPRNADEKLKDLQAVL